MPGEPSAWVKGVPLEFEPRCDCGCAYPTDRRESLQSMTPTPEQIALAKRVPYSSAAIAEAIAEAELRGHTRAVQETAAKLANVARWEAEPFRYPGYILLLGRSNRRVAQIDRPRASGGEWRACWRPNKRSFTTEAEARAYLESEAKRRGWTVKP